MKSRDDHGSGLAAMKAPATELEHDFHHALTALAQLPAQFNTTPLPDLDFPGAVPYHHFISAALLCV